MAVVLSGCGPDLPKTYPVSGRVVLNDGDSGVMTGHYVEAVLEGDPNVRASGVIAPDGTFALDTLHAGTVIKGVQEGKYQVRILRAEEDDDGKKLKKPPIADRFFRFDASRLSLQVPSADEAILSVSAK